MTKELDLGEALKIGMRRLASGVCVISAVDAEGAPYAMTATSVTSVTDSPASMLVCVNKSTSMHGAISSGKRFCINVLDAEHEAISNRCASGDQGVSRFDLGSWKDSEQLPYLTDSLASFICNLDRLIDHGTHTIVIGEVIKVIVADTDEAIDPLIYVNGGYQRISR